MVRGWPPPHQTTSQRAHQHHEHAEQNAHNRAELDVQCDVEAPGGGGSAYDESTERPAKEADKHSVENGEGWRIAGERKRLRQRLPNGPLLPLSQITRERLVVLVQ